MHSTPRSTEPEFLAELRAGNSQWDDLTGLARQRIRNRLTQDFGEVCAYCQRLCNLPSRAQKPNDESIDHFRPRHKFPSLWLDWLNLIYACRMCNQNKDNKWPGGRDTYDEVTNRILSQADFRYSPVSEYVNPNEMDGQRQADEFFDFEVNTGRVTPSELLAPEEWSIAKRTIWDNVMLRFMLPKMPFSRFIYAYATSRFPLLTQIH